MRCADIVWHVRQEYPDKIMICENLPYEKDVVESGNFHAGWWVELHHQVESAFKAESNADLVKRKAGNQWW